MQHGEPSQQPAPPPGDDRARDVGGNLGAPQARELTDAGNDAVIQDEAGNIIDPRLPREDDWNFRPYSPSEIFVEPDEERALASATVRDSPNIPAILGAGFALLGFVTGFWGFLLALTGYVVSAVGIGFAIAGARRGLLAVAGFVVAIVYILGHTAGLG